MPRPKIWIEIKILGQVSLDDLWKDTYTYTVTASHLKTVIRRKQKLDQPFSASLFEHNDVSHGPAILHNVHIEMNGF